VLRVTTADGRVARWCSDETTPLDDMVRELFGDGVDVRVDEATPE
jgi:hypothetical protein